MAAKKRDYYQVLGLRKDADDTEIKRAFREVARQVHPDLNPGKGSENRFKEANEAYAVLSDPRQRAKYDKFGMAGLGNPADAPGFESVMSAVDDLIGDLLRRRKSKKRGRDVRYTLEVSLAEAAFGCEKTIEVDLPTSQGTKSGSATAEEGKRTFSVKVPRGTADGAIRTIRGEGAVGPSGGAPGDLCIIIRVRHHPVLERNGYDIVCEVPIGFVQAALGDQVEVPTLEGLVKMRVPAGTQSGRVFRIRSKGVPKSSAKNSACGDQLVKVVVETPTGLSETQKDLLTQFAEASSADGVQEIAHPRRRGFLDAIRDLIAP